MNLIHLNFIILVVMLPTQLFSQNKVDLVEQYDRIFFYQPVKTESQNWVNESPLFPEGNFYQFKGLIKNDTTFSYEINNPELMLGFLMGLGIEIEDAWYKGQENSCGLFEVIVSSSLAIRTKTNENKELLKRYGFTEVGKPFADCPYNVIHYIFN